MKKGKDWTWQGKTGLESATKRVGQFSKQKLENEAGKEETNASEQASQRGGTLRESSGERQVSCPGLLAFWLGEGD